MSEMKKYDFFLCYTRNDHAVVQLFQAELEKCGASFFDLEKDICASSKFEDVITTAIRNARVMIVFCSANAENSRWVYNEYQYAIRLNIPVVPIWLEGFNRYGRFGFDLALINGFDYSSSSVQDIIAKLCRDFNNTNTGEASHNVGDSKPEAIPESKITSVVDKKKKRVIVYLLCVVALVVGIIGFGGICFVGSDKVGAVSETNPYDNQVELPHNDGYVGVAGSALGGDDPFGGKNIAPSVYIISSIVLALLITAVVIIYYRKSRLLSIRFYNKKINGRVDVYVDSVCQATIESGGTKSIANKKGEYAIRIQSKEVENKYIEFIQPFNKQEVKKIVNINLNEERDNDTYLNKPLKTYRCFIGGSTQIVHERNAARAVLSILYNRWDQYDFKITAHTYEDFTQKHKIGGNQMEYDEFIKQNADCTIFIICNHVGDKTLGEYQLAVEVCEKTNNQRPAVFVYNDISCEGDESVIKFKKLVDSNRAYWKDYQDLTQFMLELQNDLNAELTNLLLM